MDQGFVKLAQAAKEGDERAFVQIAGKVKWKTRAPEDFLQVIQWAFAAGAHTYARRLAKTGATRFPENTQLQKYAAILAPPKVVEPDPTFIPDMSADQAWLKKHEKMYPDQWVALENGNLLGTAPTLKELIAQVGRQEGILFTKGI
jgi:hypothetical protein